MRRWTLPRQRKRSTRLGKPSIASIELVGNVEKGMTNRSCAAMLTAVSVALAGALSMTALAQQPSSAKAKWATADVLPLTCAQAWVKSTKSYPKMLSIVVTLARVSLANRDLTFPNTRAAGLQAGRGIADDCKADPNALLFAIVDKHVRSLAEASTNPGK